MAVGSISCDHCCTYYRLVKFKGLMMRNEKNWIKYFWSFLEKIWNFEQALLFLPLSENSFLPFLYAVLTWVCGKWPPTPLPPFPLEMHICTRSLVWLWTTHWCQKINDEPGKNVKAREKAYTKFQMLFYFERKQWPYLTY